MILTKPIDISVVKSRSINHDSGTFEVLIDEANAVPYLLNVHILFDASETGRLNKKTSDIF